MKNGNKSTITSNNILLNRYDHMPRVAFNILEEKKNVNRVGNIVIAKRDEVALLLNALTE